MGEGSLVATDFRETRSLDFEFPGFIYGQNIILMRFFDLEFCKKKKKSINQIRKDRREIGIVGISLVISTYSEFLRVRDIFKTLYRRFDFKFCKNKKSVNQMEGSKRN